MTTLRKTTTTLDYLYKPTGKSARIRIYGKSILRLENIMNAIYATRIVGRT